jgi:hypothetical protein
MSAAPDFHLTRSAEPRSDSSSPVVFVRTLSTPPGAPWDQARAARLEAQVGAPLPLDEVIYQLHRLEAWRPKRPGRYAACYVRIEDAGDAFSQKVNVSGHSVLVRFLSTEERNRRALKLGGAAVILAVFAFLVGGAVTSAFSLRSELSGKLAVVEQTAQIRTRAAQAQDQLASQARLLDRAGVRHQGLRDVLSDLAWASSAKSPDAHVDAYHWDHGRLAVEVRGDAAPFAQSGRTVVKDDKPLRPGVWLWGVEPAKAADAGVGP